jgi:hypothetical protein
VKYGKSVTRDFITPDELDLEQKLENERKKKYTSAYKT